LGLWSRPRNETADVPVEVPVKSTSKKVSSTSSWSLASRGCLIFFFNGWIIQKEFLPWGESVNQTFCMGDQMCLTEVMGGKRQDNWHTYDWRLHRDIAPAHTALSVQPSLTESNTAVHKILLPRPNPLWRLRVSKDDDPMKGTKIQGCPWDWSWNTDGTGETRLPRYICSGGAKVGFVKTSAVKSTLCTGASINLCPYFYNLSSDLDETWYSLFRRRGIKWL